jgi:predicted house-cleaning NTP pyrophosphatase (Maf/HAM1 superfamily)
MKLDAQSEAEHHDRMVGELEKVYKERDEAREAFVIATDQMVIAQGKVREANKERDEARVDAAQLADRLSGLELRTADELAKMEQERNASRELAIAFHNDQTNLILLLQEWRDMAAKLVNIASYALGEFDVQLTLEQQRTITETMRQYHSLLKKK